MHTEATRRNLVRIRDVEDNQKGTKGAVKGEDDIGDLTADDMELDAGKRWNCHTVVKIPKYKSSRSITSKYSTKRYKKVTKKVPISTPRMKDHPITSTVTTNRLTTRAHRRTQAAENNSRAHVGKSSTPQRARLKKPGIIHEVLKGIKPTNPLYDRLINYRTYRIE